MNRLFLFLLLSLASCFAAKAQSIDMAQAISFAQDSAITVFSSRNSLQRAEWEYKRFMATRKPQLTFELTPGYQKFSNEPNLKYYKLRDYNTLNTIGEIRLEQEVTQIGGSFYASSSFLWTENLGNDPVNRIFSTIPLGIGYSNDMIGYNSHKWDKAINDFQIESQRKAFEYELCGIARNAAALFIKCLVAQSNYDICKTNTDVTGKALEISREKFSIAAISKNDLLAMELEYLNAQNTVFDAEQECIKARESLFSYLQLEDTGQKLVMPELPEYRFIDIDEAIAMAKSNNPDYRNRKEDILTAQKNADKARIEASWLRASMDINLGLQSNNNLIARIYSNQKFWTSTSVSFIIPIWDSGLTKSKKKVAEYELNYTLSSLDEQTRQLELDVRLAIKDFNTQQDLLRRTFNSLKLADESFELARDLYENGETDINTFTLALNRKDQSYQNYLSSLTKYWESWYSIKLLCVLPD